MIKDFIIPINKDELLQSRNGQYFVEKIVSIRILPQALDGMFQKFYVFLYLLIILILFIEAKSALQMNGINFILDHFDTFFSLIVHGNKIELPIIMRGFNRIHKGKKKYIYNVYLFIYKHYCYLI